MVKKVTFIILAGILILTVALPALAGAAGLTEDQAKELTALHKQMAEIKKQIIDKKVSYGLLTPEQGQQIKANLEKRLQYLESNPEAYGPGNGKRFGRWRKGDGNCLSGGMFGRCWNQDQAASSPANSY